MKTIKFRGLDLVGHWYYGLLSNQKDKGWCISNSYGSPFAYPIRPETIGQFTGLLDRQGKEIYEGDIVSHPDYINLAIVWDSDEAQWQTSSGVGIHKRNDGKLEVIGNIYENKELLD